MAAQENNQGDANNDYVKLSESKLEHHEITCPTVGNLHVYIQGNRAKYQGVILTVHDLGCNHTMFLDFVEHPLMCHIRKRTLWVHVDIPGQEPDAPDLPSGFVFPTMQKLGEELVHVLDQLKIKEVVCFGEGAGANILARFAMAHLSRVLGVCLLHCTGTTAGFMESIKDKVINWKLDHIGMNPTAEAYLVLHRFGLTEPEFNKAEDKDELKAAIENYQANLRTRTNPKNLRKFVETFLKRTNIAEKIEKLTCPVLLLTGSKSVFKSTTRTLHQALVKRSENKGKIEFIEMANVANVLEECPEKLAESLQYFLQGLGIASAIPMQHVMLASRPMRMRSMSMEEADQPKLRRSISQGSGGAHSPLSTSPPTGDPVPPPSTAVVN